MAESYSYTPNRLLESFRNLQSREEAALAGSATKEEAPAALAAAHPVSSSSFVAAAVQFTAAGMPHSEVEGFWNVVQQAVQDAAGQGARLILIPELFLGPYFCQTQETTLLGLALEDVETCFITRRMQQLAKQYSVVLPVSLFERDQNVLYNTVVMVDADGSVLGKYRKSHIPDGVGYQEKFYFSPGDTGFRVWNTKVGKVGVAICWDQWFPEAARAMALQGADVLLYPTAIGSEPPNPTLDSSDHWQRTMQGHAAANVSTNRVVGRPTIMLWRTTAVMIPQQLILLFPVLSFKMVPVVASNRQGTEILLNDDGTERQRITFYGRSFITDATGALVAHADRTIKCSSTAPFQILTATIDPGANRSSRLAWGLFRDRRPELYPILLTKDGKQSMK